jgi:hypothetical protein
MQKVLYERIHRSFSSFSASGEFGVENMRLQGAFGETEGHNEVDFYKGGLRMTRHYWHLLFAGNCSGLSTPPMLPLEYSLGEVQQVSQMFQMYTAATAASSTTAPIRNRFRAKKQKVANVRTIDPEMKDGKD